MESTLRKLVICVDSVFGVSDICNKLEIYS